MATEKELKKHYEMLAKKVSTHLPINQAIREEVDAYANLRKEKNAAFLAWHAMADMSQPPAFVDEVPSGEVAELPSVSVIKEPIPETYE